MQDMPRNAIEKFSVALMTPPYSLQMIAGLEGRIRPVFNVTVSNAPGLTEPLYFRGARLEAMYPVSAVIHGQALNITCYSYAGTLTFGFAGCRDTLLHRQRLADYTGDALQELEQVFARALAATSAADRPKNAAFRAQKPMTRRRATGSKTTQP